MLLSALTFDELHVLLPGIDVDVPPRPAKRKNNVEIYSIVRLLGSIPLSRQDFPLQLKKCERPDFSMQLGERSIGVEHTEAVPQNAAKEANLRAQGHGSQTYMIRQATIHDALKSGKQLIDEIIENRLPPPAVGDSVERDWTDAMAHFIHKKVLAATSNLKRAGYTMHDENWLLIYDNWPSIALKLEHALALLQARLTTSDPFQVFRRIFILDEKVLVELGHSHVLLHRVNHRER